MRRWGRTPRLDGSSTAFFDQIWKPDEYKRSWPLTHRAKLLMLIQSTISRLTSVLILSRAINVLPS